MTLKDNRQDSSGRPISNLVSNIAIVVLGFTGIGISGYLTYVHYALIKPVCVFDVDCDVVLASSYSQIWDVPLALIGLVMYAVITAFGLLLWSRESVWEHLIALATYEVSLAGVIFNVYLYYLEIFVLHAYCSWCIFSSIVLLTIFAISAANFILTKRRLELNPHVRRFKLSDFIRW